MQQKILQRNLGIKINGCLESTPKIVWHQHQSIGENSNPNKIMRKVNRWPIALTGTFTSQAKHTNSF